MVLNIFSVMLPFCCKVVSSELILCVTNMFVLKSVLKWVFLKLSVTQQLCSLVRFRYFTRHRAQNQKSDSRVGLIAAERQAQRGRYCRGDGLYFCCTKDRTENTVIPVQFKLACFKRRTIWTKLQNQYLSPQCRSPVKLEIRTIPRLYMSARCRFELGEDHCSLFMPSLAFCRLANGTLLFWWVVCPVRQANCWPTYIGTNAQRHGLFDQISHCCQKKVTRWTKKVNRRTKWYWSPGKYKQKCSFSKLCHIEPCLTFSKMQFMPWVIYDAQKQREALQNGNVWELA